VHICPACGSQNEAGRKFCGECGVSLAIACPACGAANSPGVKFCGECGCRLAAESAPRPAEPASERRLVTVIFADLVGFTSMSEARDTEDVRELLSRYFDVCRQLVTRYGGTIEKFIGDSVMAVWGTPVAQEDDAERAVRTALDLVADVQALGEELRLPARRARSSRSCAPGRGWRGSSARPRRRRSPEAQIAAATSSAARRPVRSAPSM
jgi:Adenylate and Guanylate cyclase catalytic domain/Double zinc ribbon